MKKTLAVMMMACMLLTVTGVSSVSNDAENSILTCGFTAETEIEELP